MSDGAKIRALADELQRDPVKKANNLVKLLAAVDATASEVRPPALLQAARDRSLCVLRKPSRHAHQRQSRPCGLCCSPPLARPSSA